MAIDTRNKRFSMMSLSMPFLGRDLPVADGTITQEDRQQFLWGYAGIVWAGGVVVATAAAKAIVSPITMTGGLVIKAPGLRRGAARGIIR